MRCANVLRLGLVAVAFGACSSSKPQTPVGDGSVAGDIAGTDLASNDGGNAANRDMESAANPDLSVLAANVVPLIVDSGPMNAMYGSYNVPYVTIRLCAPGSTTNCATIDHVSVDTGSTGLRVLSSALTPALISALTTVTDASSNPVTECYAFADGYVWGSVKKADLTIGSKSVSAMPFQVIGDPSFPTVPSLCTGTGSAEDTLDTFGANGLIGVGLYTPDCGSDCISASSPYFNQEGWLYYSCPTASTCAQTTMAIADQVPNPVAQFATDNNGVLIQLPAVGAAGATNTTGTLTFGIGTQSNNALGAATIYSVGNQDSGGALDVKFNSQTYTYGFFDSGSTDISFNDSAIPGCTGDDSGWDCPTSTLSLTAQIVDASSTGHTVTFSVANTDDLFNGDPTGTAFSNICSPGGDSMTFDWGLPFFYGRNMFSAIDGMSTPGGNGPYYAF